MKTEIKVGIIFITFSIILGGFLVYDSHRRSDKNIERADLMLSSTWDSEYTIDSNHLSTDSVIFYSEGQQYEIDTTEWKISER